MEVLRIGHQREELDIELEGKSRGDNFMYLGSVCGDGKTKRGVRRRVQAGANEGVMTDRRRKNWVRSNNSKSKDGRQVSSSRLHMQWAGNVERMADDRLPKRPAELREEDRRRRGRRS